MAACRIAGVKPKFEELNGATDPFAYILSANINRRHMTKGQCAMAVAMIYPEPSKLKRGSLQNKHQEFSKTALSQARTVLAVLPELAARKS
jgi:hypothetical protein